MPRAKGQSSLAKNQLQLAIALSSSLEESKTRELSKLAEELPADAIEDGAVPHNIKQMQKEFLERLQPKPVAGPARRTRKVVNSAIPTLVSRSSEERLRIITEKVALVLIKDDTDIDYPLTQAKKARVQDESNKENVLWQKASGLLTDNDRRSYYVDSLSVYLFPSQMSGRNEDQQPQCSASADAVRTDRRDDELREAPAYYQNQINVGYRKELKDKLSAGLKLDWSCFVNVSILSDVTIIIMGKEKLWAHKLVLRARCPKVLKDLVGGNKIHWPDVTRSVALAVLDFVYTGNFKRMAYYHDYESYSILVKLAKKYEILDLAEVVQECMNRAFGYFQEQSVDDPQTGVDLKGNLQSIMVSPNPDDVSTDLDGRQSEDSLDPRNKNDLDGSSDLFAGMDEAGVPTSPLAHQQDSLLPKVVPAATVRNQADSSSTAAEVILVSDDDDDELMCDFFGSNIPTPLSPPLKSASATTSLGSQVTSGKQNDAARQKLKEGRPSPPLPPPPPRPPPPPPLIPLLPLRCYSPKTRNDPRFITAMKLKEDQLLAQHQVQEPLDLTKPSGQDLVVRSMSLALHEKECMWNHAPGVIPPPPGPGFTPLKKKSKRCYGGSSSQDVEVIVLDDDEVVPVVTKRKVGGSKEEDLVHGETAKKVCVDPADEPIEVPTREGLATNPASVKSKSTLSIAPLRQLSQSYRNDFEDPCKHDKMGTRRSSQEDPSVNRHEVDKRATKRYSPPPRCETPYNPEVNCYKEDNQAIEMLDDSFVSILNSSYLTPKTVIKIPLVPKEEVEVPMEGTPLRTPLTDVKTSSPVTPMPDYTAMSNQQFEEELLRNGLKRSLSRYHGTRLLQRIYGEFHPLVEVVNRRGKQLLMPIGGKPSSTRAAATLPQPPQKSPIPDEHETGLVAASSTPISSSSNDYVRVAEASVSHPDQEQDSPQEISDLKTEIRKWVANQPNLHERILSYDTIFLTSIFGELKEHLKGNFSLKMKDLMEVLASESVSYRVMQPPAEKSTSKETSPKKDTEKDDDKEA